MNTKRLFSPNFKKSLSKFGQSNNLSKHDRSHENTAAIPSALIAIGTAAAELGSADGVVVLEVTTVGKDVSVVPGTIDQLEGYVSVAVIVSVIVSVGRWTIGDYATMHCFKNFSE